MRKRGVKISDSYSRKYGDRIVLIAVAVFTATIFILFRPHAYAWGYILSPLRG